MQGWRTTKTWAVFAIGQGAEEGVKMSWDYKIEMIHLYGMPSDLIVRRLNELGSEGWEIISTISKGGETTGVLMKREKSRESESARRLFAAI